MIPGRGASPSAEGLDVTNAWVKRPRVDQALRVRFKRPSPIMAPVVIGAFKCVHQSLHSSGGAVKALARSDNLDLDDATLTTANTVDGVDAEPAADKQPGHQKLSHRIPLSEHACQGCAPLLFLVPITCCLPRNACCDRPVAAKECSVL